MLVIRRSAVVAALLLVAVGLVACGSGSSGPELTHCPKHPPGVAGGSAGTPGETVETQPKSALICRWRDAGSGLKRDEVTVVRGLLGLVATLNNLPPPLEGEFACPSIDGSLKYLVALHYRDSSEAEVEVDASGCGAVSTEDHSYALGPNLERRLSALLDGA
jgi:hypothetical protein